MLPSSVGSSPLLSLPVEESLCKLSAYRCLSASFQMTQFVFQYGTYIYHQILPVGWNYGLFVKCVSHSRDQHRQAQQTGKSVRMHYASQHLYLESWVTGFSVKSGDHDHALCHDDLQVSHTVASDQHMKLCLVTQRLPADNVIAPLISQGNFCSSLV